MKKSEKRVVDALIAWNLRDGQKLVVSKFKTLPDETSQEFHEEEINGKKGEDGVNDKQQDGEVLE